MKTYKYCHIFYASESSKDEIIFSDNKDWDHAFQEAGYPSDLLQLWYHKVTYNLTVVETNEIPDDTFDTPF